MQLCRRYGRGPGSSGFAVCRFSSARNLLGNRFIQNLEVAKMDFFHGELSEAFVQSLELAAEPFAERDACLTAGPKIDGHEARRIIKIAKKAGADIRGVAPKEPDPIAIRAICNPECRRAFGACHIRPDIAVHRNPPRL